MKCYQEIKDKNNLNIFVSYICIISTTYKKEKHISDTDNTIEVDRH